MQLWKSLICAGNTQYSQFQFDNALNFYQQSLEQAIAIFDIQQQIDFDAAISAILISHCNLADCYLELGQAQEGCNQYQRAFAFLQQLQLNKLDSHYQQALFKANSKLHQQWLDFLNRYDTNLAKVSFLKSKISDLFARFSNAHILSNFQLKTQ